MNNPSLNHLVLYGTYGCHLCEQAQQIIYQVLGADASDIVTEIDIASDDDLLERYGVRIPVLRKKHSDNELDWPFDHDQVIQFVTNPSSN